MHKSSKFSVLKVSLWLVPLFCLQGCQVLNPNVVETNKTESWELIIDKRHAANYLAVNTDAGANIFICKAPSPDTVVSEVLSSQATVAGSPVGGPGNANVNNASARNGQSGFALAGRAPVVLVTREILFRFCELTQNYRFDKDQALNAYANTLRTLSEVITSLNGVGATPGDATTNSANHVNTPTPTPQGGGNLPHPGGGAGVSNQQQPGSAPSATPTHSPSGK